jgi:hypothetical protein
VFALEPNDLVWRGPFDSPYGVHLVLLITNEPGREPELSEIVDRVREDWRRSAISEKSEAAISDIVDAYDVQVVYQRSPAPITEKDSPPQ